MQPASPNLSVSRLEPGNFFRGAPKIAVPVVCGGVYGLITSRAVFRAWPHYELIGIVLQAALLLPATVYAFRNGGGTPLRPPVSRFHRGLWTLAFLAAALPAGWRVFQGVTNPDESAYRFQARILGSGHLVAASLPNSPSQGGRIPEPIRFNQHILSTSGWFTK